ncbi:MAG: homoserine dehydrogenase [Fimbriimonas sp.]
MSSSIASRVVRVGILGFGTVGSGAYRMLQDNRESIERKIGFAAEVVKIGIRDETKSRSLPAEMFTSDLQSIVDDPTIDVILELMGGVDPAAELVERALNQGKAVVTANKELIAKQGARLVALAKSKGLDLHYEAAVGGGIPLVQPLKHQLAGNDVIRMMGILNGTTNYILTKMQTEGADFDDVLREAQAKGYAEADPTNDVDGFDTMYKISILASIAFHRRVPVEEVYREGIRSVSQLDIKYADMLGYRIKLLGIVDAVSDGQILARVHPTLVPKSHPLSSVNDVYNALYLHGDFVGDLMFSGRGAGSDPTASAVIGDLIDVGRNIAVGGSGSAIPYDENPLTVLPIQDLRTAFYLRIRVEDRPKVLGMIATEFGNFNVSLAGMEMKTLGEGKGEIVFLTHPCRELDFRQALEALQATGVVAELGTSIRVVN